MQKTENSSSEVNPQETTIRTKRVWPMPIRLFHWILVLVVCICWVIGEYFSTLYWTGKYHFYLGYIAGALLVFRILWGLCASGPTALSALFPAPKAVWKYLKGIFSRTPSYVDGHNPMGALSALALIGSLAVQVITGLFARNDETWFTEGPLTKFAGEKLQTTLNEIHEINSGILLFLVALHLGAILYYLLWKRENLILPMITGWKKVRQRGASVHKNK